jgi:hypothetical protein
MVLSLRLSGSFVGSSGDAFKEGMSDVGSCTVVASEAELMELVSLAALTWTTLLRMP